MPRNVDHASRRADRDLESEAGWAKPPRQRTKSAMRGALASTAKPSREPPRRP